MMNVHQFLALFLLASALAISAQRNDEEEFSEELLLRPLPDGKVLAHFHFTHQLPPTARYGHHHILFPKAIFQLVQKFRIQEMELSFTQGRWNYHKWGGVDPLTRLHAKPLGVELWATFAVSDDLIDATWGNLTHALSGLFCASLNFLDSTVMVANPLRSFTSDYDMDAKSLSLAGSFEREPNRGKNHGGRVRYGALPREAICTENLTPWLKLLPCRDRAGLATLLDRPTIYTALYHSLRLYVRSHEFDNNHIGADMSKGTFLQQTLTLVIRPSESSIIGEVRQRLQPNWSIVSLFGRDLKGRCLLAKSSSIFLEFGPQIVNLLEDSGFDIETSSIHMPDRANLSNDFTQSNSAADEKKDIKPICISDFKENGFLKVIGVPSCLFFERTAYGNAAILTFVIPKQAKHHSLNIGLTWKVPVTWSPPRGPFRATRFLVGSGNARAAIALVLKSNQLQTGHSVGAQSKISKDVESSTIGDMINVTIFQVVPWYIRLYFHTLQVLIDEKPKSLWEVVKWMQVVPSKDRISPGVMEIELAIPYNTGTIALIIEFDKGFLHIDEHPPDANRGFDLPSMLLSFRSKLCSGQYYHLGNDTDAVPAQDSALLKELQKKKAIQVYTEVLLVPLATPDFSMPYNVITLTCTVLALYFGSLLNVLRRRIGEEERLLHISGEQPQSMLERMLSRLLGSYGNPPTTARVAKILKVILVVVIGVALNHFFSNS